MWSSGWGQSLKGLTLVTLTRKFTLDVLTGIKWSYFAIFSANSHKIQYILQLQVHCYSQVQPHFLKYHLKKVAFKTSVYSRGAWNYTLKQYTIVYVIRRFLYIQSTKLFIKSVWFAKTQKEKRAFQRKISDHS